MKLVDKGDTTIVIREAMDQKEEKYGNIDSKSGYQKGHGTGYARRCKNL